MSRKEMLLSVAALAVGGLFAASPASAANVITIGTYPGGVTPGYFYISGGSSTGPSVTADFGDTISGSATSFDDQYVFTIPQNGTGSGSLSTSFSAASNELTISEVLINGVSYALNSSSSGQSLTVSGIPITAGATDTIEVEGVTAVGNSAATYTGTATFAAGVPEPASWALMIGGLGLAGAALRRRRGALQIA